MQTLSRALQALGGEAPLAKKLGVSYLRARALLPPAR